LSETIEKIKILTEKKWHNCSNELNLLVGSQLLEIGSHS